MVGPFITEILERLSKEKLDLDWCSGRRILVTGGAGFIGSWLVEALVRMGSNAYVVDNLWRGSLKNLRREDGKSWIPLSSNFLLGDLRDYYVALEEFIVWDRVNKPGILYLLEMLSMRWSGCH